MSQSIIVIEQTEKKIDIEKIERARYHPPGTYRVHTGTYRVKNFYHSIPGTI